MQRAGSVSNVAQGVAIVQCQGSEHPGLGAPVIDENLDTIGRVVDVFGPTDQPLLAITPAGGVALPSLLGTVLYYRPD
jgi:RNA-binding protein